MRILLIFAIFSLTLCFLDIPPASPIWPDQFTQSFSEDLTVTDQGTHQTTGQIYYSYPRYRKDRVNGRYEEFCGITGPFANLDAACNQFVDEKGDRYIHYPELNQCCYCCSKENGCGALKKDWLHDAKFMGTVEMQDKTQAFKWSKKGGQDNFYFETTEIDPKQRKMLSIIEVPNDTHYFDKNSLKFNFDSKVLDVPSICDRHNECPEGSMCAVIRKL